MRVAKLVFAAVSLPLAVGAFTVAGHAKNDKGPQGNAYGYDNGNAYGHDNDRGAESTPAPIAGAGLLALGPAGAMVYWLVRRVRRQKDDSL